MGQVVRKKDTWTVIGRDGDIIEIKVDGLFAKIGNEEGWRCFNDESGIERWAKERI